LAKSKLNKDGLFIASFIGDLNMEKHSFIFSEINTFKSVFKNSYFFAVNSPTSSMPQNIVMVGHNSDKLQDLSGSVLTSFNDPFIRSLTDKKIIIESSELAEYPIMTDDYSPVEFLTGQLLRRTL